MRKELQRSLLLLLKEELKGRKSIGAALMETLDLSKESAYRRYRLEKELSLTEVVKLQQEYNISMEEIVGRTEDSEESTFMFVYRSAQDNPLDRSYVMNELYDLLMLMVREENAEIHMTNYHLPYLQLMNFPELMRFKSFLVGKNMFQNPNKKIEKYSNFHLSFDALQAMDDIARLYNKIPSSEIYDSDLFRGMTREIQYFTETKTLNEIEAEKLYDELYALLDHLKVQANCGRKSCPGDSESEYGAEIKMYFNEIINPSSIFFYRSARREGVSIAYNFAKLFRTKNRTCIQENEQFLNAIISSSQLISASNEKVRNKYFNSIRKIVDDSRKKVIEKVAKF